MRYIWSMYDEVLLLRNTLCHGKEVTVTWVGDGHDTGRNEPISGIA